eukprot:TRINITY_DN7706_c0_g2_i1.p2 TRINITY_DN7706_c0_g2~~TRINITY_DN7706_c0_g2_i1.p2  ORF type:complete len:178 (+),score=33.76 TRINITY_DN7706_c0_g2_i1:855-1388(+)
MSVPRGSDAQSKAMECLIVSVALLLLSGLLKANRWEFVNDWDMLLTAMTCCILQLILIGVPTAFDILAIVAVMIALGPVLLYLSGPVIHKCIGENLDKSEKQPSSKALEGLASKSVESLKLEKSKEHPISKAGEGLASDTVTEGLEAKSVESLKLEKSKEHSSSKAEERLVSDTVNV